VNCSLIVLKLFATFLSSVSWKKKYSSKARFMKHREEEEAVLFPLLSESSVVAAFV